MGFCLVQGNLLEMWGPVLGTGLRLLGVSLGKQQLRRVVRLENALLRSEQNLSSKRPVGKNRGVSHDTTLYGLLWVLRIEACAAGLLPVPCPSLFLVVLVNPSPVSLKSSNVLNCFLHCGK